MSIRLTLYTRSRCKLCDEARQVLEDVQSRLSPTLTVELDIADIALSPSLWETYRLDAPVVLLDGHVLFRHRVDPGSLEARLLRGEPTPLESERRRARR